jgi:hypothetical protein
MPHKRRKFVTTVEPPDPPPAPGAATLDALVRATLVDFDELDVLPNDVKDRLIGDLVESIKRARAGSQQSTDELFDRKEREKADKSLGWPSCRAIRDSGCKACETCPQFSKGKSPLHLALVVEQRPALEIVPPKAGPLPTRGPIS